MLCGVVRERSFSMSAGETDPQGCFDYTMSAPSTTTDRLIAEAPEAAAAAVRALCAAQSALKSRCRPSSPTVGRKRFPPAEAELIAELIRRDLPYYDPSISPEFVAGMNQFARDVGILHGDAPCEKVVATQFEKEGPRLGGD